MPRVTFKGHKSVEIEEGVSILDAAMDSRIQGGRPLRTPHLMFAYKPMDFREMREMGASWKIITEDRPEPKGIEFGGT